MKINIFKQLLKLTATAMACAVLLIIGNPTNTPTEPGEIGNGLTINRTPVKTRIRNQGYHR